MFRPFSKLSEISNKHAMNFTKLKHFHQTLTSYKKITWFWWWLSLKLLPRLNIVFNITYVKLITLKSLSEWVNNCDQWLYVLKKTTKMNIIFNLYKSDIVFTKINTLFNKYAIFVKSLNYTILSNCIWLWF